MTFTDIGDGLDVSTIDGDEVTIGGVGVGTAILNGTAVLQSGTTYRYAFTGDFVKGQCRSNLWPIHSRIWPAI